jgi:CHAT domain-containing protein
MLQQIKKEIVIPLISLILLFGFASSAQVVFSQNEPTKVNVQAITEGKIRCLTLKTPVTDQLFEDKIHTCEFSLLAGEFVHIQIEQSNVSLTFALKNRENLTLLKGRTRQNSSTPILFIAESPGIYRLQLTATWPPLPQPVQYELKLAEVRKATSTDKRRLRSNALIAEAEELRSKWQAESFQIALKKYETARLQCHATGNLLEEAYTLRGTAEIYRILSEYKKALTFYEQALALYQTEKNSKGEIDALNNIGYMHSVLGGNELFLSYSNKALDLSRDAMYLRGQAQALHNLGEANFYDDPQKALQYFTTALSVWEKTGSLSGQAETLTHTGHVLTVMGEPHKALTIYERALTLWEQAHDLQGRSRILTAIGSIFSRFGEKQKALDLHKQALQILQAIGNRDGEAVSLNDIGFLYEDLGETQNALNYYNAALALFRQTGNREGEAFTISYFGSVYASLGQKQKALEYFQQSLALAMPLGDRRIQGLVLRAIGSVYNFMNARSKALDYYQQALSAAQATGNIGIQAQVLNDIGSIYTAAGDKAKAFDLFSQSLKLSKDVDQRTEITVLHNLARLERNTKNIAQARFYIEEVFHKIESLRTKFGGQEMRASFFATVHNSYELYIDILMRESEIRGQESQKALALNISERKRARCFLDMLAETKTDIRQGVEPNLLERERQLQQLINDKADRQTSLLASSPTKDRARAMEKDIEFLLDEYQQLQVQIKMKSPHYAELTQPQPLDSTQIKQLLDEETVLLEYSLGDEQSFVWVVTNHSISCFTLPNRATIEDAARQVYELLIAPNKIIKGETPIQREARISHAEVDYPKAALRLSQMILAPAASLLGTKRLVIAADGALQYIPFTALPDPKPFDNKSNAQPKSTFHPLLEDHEIINLPSASALAAIRREHESRKPAPKAVAVIADPVFNKEDAIVRTAELQQTRGMQKQTRTSDLQQALRQMEIEGKKVSLDRLLFSREEALAILSSAPPGESLGLLDFQANKETVTHSNLYQYRIVHFATHGLLNSEHPELSGIFLSLVDKDGKPQDGVLRLHEIYNLKLPVELVVLSACQTALGKEIKGEGLMGLTRGFMYAGAARVVASLWNVNDTATADLMSNFYKRMLQEGQRPAEALRNAQLKLLHHKDWHSPYYWAAFTLQGEWK